jgi:hypothetical protein
LKFDINQEVVNKDKLQIFEEKIFKDFYSGENCRKKGEFFFSDHFCKLLISPREVF